jgi:cytochrome b pre-mRNA-processing protein 3
MTAKREQVLWPVSRGLFGRFSSWLGGRRADRIRLAKAFALYHVIVARARQEPFYTAWGVPDTPDGRLELIGLHAALLMRRLRSEGEAGKVVAQDLFDVMFADVDRNIREQGVGDLSVGKHVKAAAKTFLARFRALDPCLDAEDAPAVAAILERNIFNRVAGEAMPADAPIAPGMLALAAYALAEEKRLAAVPGADLLEGQCALPPVTFEPLASGAAVTVMAATGSGQAGGMGR